MLYNTHTDSLILEIQRMSTEDGPGIRTTVFMKGCPLSCIWCHNPESISPYPQVHWIESRCIGCKICLKACPDHALSDESDKIIINRSLCKGCGICSKECPSTAMELIGRKWSLEGLVNEVIKDKAYFLKSGGGVTVSGGEPTLQSEFVSEFFKLLKKNNIQTALDTCGLSKKESFDKILPYTDVILYDIKEIDPIHHETFTGSSNQRILENLIYIASYLKKSLSYKTLYIRTPVIPDTTATKDNIDGIGRFIAKHLDGIVNRWELCAFNNLCKDKYIRLGKVWYFKNKKLMTKETMSELTKTAKQSGVNPDIVIWSGSTEE